MASSVILIGIAAACTLSLAMVSQEEGNIRASRALSVFEDCAHLYQLDMDPADILAIVPADNAVVNITMTDTTGAVAGVGVPESIDIQMEFSTAMNKKMDSPTGEDIDYRAGTWTGGADGSAYNRFTETMAVYRSSVRATGY